MYKPITQEELDAVTSIRFWYDRSTRSWIIQRMDADGNQMGEALYNGNKEDRDHDLRDLERKHHIIPRKV